MTDQDSLLNKYARRYAKPLEGRKYVNHLWGPLNGGWGGFWHRQQLLADGEYIRTSEQGREWTEIRDLTGTYLQRVYYDNGGHL